jgi:hypothetical protein
VKIRRISSSLLSLYGVPLLSDVVVAAAAAAASDTSSSSAAATMNLIDASYIEN